MVWGLQTRILKYNGSKWEKTGEDIPLLEFATNMEIDASDNVWLTGVYGIARLSVADFDLTSVDKADYCANDSITAVVTTNGKINVQKPLTAIFKIGTGGSINVDGLMVANNRVRIKIPDALAGTEVSLQLRATEPQVLTKSARQFKVHMLPTAAIAADKTLMVPDKDTAAVAITLTGTSPWSFKLWDNERVSTESASYSRKFVLAQPADFELNVSELADKFCTTGTVKNSVKIIANVVTGTEPALPGVSIYPNPSNDKLTIRYDNYTGKASEYFISDAKGSIVSSLKVDRGINEWDIRHLPAGMYVLWNVQNGTKRSWKIIKN